MNATFSQNAEMILSRHKQFREKLLAAIEAGPAGQCFIDGKIGITPAGDELVLLNRDRSPFNVPNGDFADVSTIRQITKWVSSSSE